MQYNCLIDHTNNESNIRSKIAVMLILTAKKIAVELSFDIKGRQQINDIRRCRLMQFLLLLHVKFERLGSEIKTLSYYAKSCR